MPSKTYPTELLDSETTAGIKTRPLSNFVRLSKVVYLYEPPQASPNPSPNAPTTILLCSWLNAVSRHVEYYAQHHMRLYPNARIILVTINTKEFLVHSEAQRRADIKEVVTALLARPRDDERLFVHTLSNGKSLPVKAYVVDSAPGIPQFRRDIRALSVPGRNLNWLLWVPFMSVVVAITSVVYVAVNWMPRWFWKELIWGPTAGLNNVELVHKDCVKGFVYSKEDIVIDFRDVEDHANMADKKGYRVVKKLVEGGQHVQLFKGKGGEKEYWAFVEKVWALGIEP
ncbi:hypothetical protein G7Y89_g5096 [Cudoniella acicularis]|uniref:Indole-diterpene biosynthesis protein PaxU n=1 Tax=Cudoniella acicularis TaxID=354080 RepID=A0A8H4RQ70_9HELO|nr:hypothetical protein G7Y89_g5096 [Cudoniella acicularis]